MKVWKGEDRRGTGEDRRLELRQKTSRLSVRPRLCHAHASSPQQHSTRSPPANRAVHARPASSHLRPSHLETILNGEHLQPQHERRRTAQAEGRLLLRWSVPPCTHGTRGSTQLTVLPIRRNRGSRVLCVQPRCVRSRAQHHDSILILSWCSTSHEAAQDQDGAQPRSQLRIGSQDGRARESPQLSPLRDTYADGCERWIATGASYSA